MVRTPMTRARYNKGQKPHGSQHAALVHPDRDLIVINGETVAEETAVEFQQQLYDAIIDLRRRRRLQETLRRQMERNKREYEEQKQSGKVGCIRCGQVWRNDESGACVGCRGRVRAGYLWWLYYIIGMRLCDMRREVSELPWNPHRHIERSHRELNRRMRACDNRGWYRRLVAAGAIDPRYPVSLVPWRRQEDE